MSKVAVACKALHPDRFQLSGGPSGHPSFRSSTRDFVFSSSHTTTHLSMEVLTSKQLHCRFHILGMSLWSIVTRARLQGRISASKLSAGNEAPPYAASRPDGHQDWHSITAQFRGHQRVQEPHMSTSGIYSNLSPPANRDAGWTQARTPCEVRLRVLNNGQNES